MEDYNKMLIPSLRNKALLNAASKPLLDYFDISYFCCFQVDRQGNYSYFSNHLDWNAYVLKEHIIKKIAYYFKFSEAPSKKTVVISKEDTKFECVHNAARDSFNIHYMLEIRECDGQQLRGYCFGARSFDFAVLTHCLSELPLLEMYVPNLFEKNPVLLQSLKENTISLFRYIGDEFSRNEQNFKYSSKSRAKFLQDMTTNPFLDLTKRENEVSVLVAEGFSAAEMAEQLFLSKRTVEHHLENLKDKLSCDSKSELIRKCQMYNRAFY